MSDDSNEKRQKALFQSLHVNNYTVKLPLTYMSQGSD